MIELAHDEFSELTVEEIRKKAVAAGLRDPYRAYAKHKGHADARGIAWEFCFRSWWEAWKDHYHLRGNGPEQMVMGRFGDTGPYSPENVYITTSRQNLEDYRTSPKMRADFDALVSRRRAELLKMANDADEFYKTWHGPQLPPELFLKRGRQESETRGRNIPVQTEP